MCSFRSLLPELLVCYLLVEQVELGQQGQGLKVLCEGPGEVSNHAPVKIGVEEDGDNEGHDNKVPGFDDVLALLVRGGVVIGDKVHDVG